MVRLLVLQCLDVRDQTCLHEAYRVAEERLVRESLESQENDRDSSEFTRGTVDKFLGKVTSNSAEKKCGVGRTGDCQAEIV